MKKIIILILLFSCFCKAHTQRLNSVKIEHSKKVQELTELAALAQTAAAKAHSSAAAAHTRSARLERSNDAGSAGIISANENAAAAHTLAATAATVAATNFTGGRPSAGASTAATAALVPAQAARAQSDTALKLETDADIQALDNLANASSIAAKEAADAAVAAEKANSDHLIEIEGLGNVLNSQNGTNLSPSASINARILLIPNNKQAKLYMAFNLGTSLDSTKLDSIKLGNLFLPDRSKAGFAARFEYNILPCIGVAKTPKTVGDYTYTTELNPFIEYNYNKINFKDAKEDSSNLQTSTWILGANFSRTIEVKANNIIGLQLTPYFKRVLVTQASEGLYSTIFRTSLKGKEPPKKVDFVGLTFGLQVNRFLFSFDYQNLLTKETLRDTPLYGGIFTLRATVIGDLIKL